MLILRFTSRLIGKKLEKVNWGPTSGAAMTEFILIFPVVMLLVMGIIQFSLAYTGKLLLEYAAFCATRAAIVIIPDEDQEKYPDEEANRVLVQGEDSAKMERIKKAAVMAMIPPSPRIDTYLEFLKDNLADFIPKLLQIPSDYEEITRILLRVGDNNMVIGDGGSRGLSVAKAVDYAPESSLASYKVFKTGLKLPYAFLGTGVRLFNPKDNGPLLKDGETETFDYSSGDDVGVEVTYLFFCAIPLVNKLFGIQIRDMDKETLDDLNQVFDSNYSLLKMGVPGYYLILRSRYVLPLESQYSWVSKRQNITHLVEIIC